jgi:hypothetical protein
MAKTEIRSAQIKDSTVNRDDLDTATTGKAVVAKIIAGTNITLGSTGVDAGTGDVTINGPTIDATVTDGSNNPVSSNAVYDAIAAIPGGGDMVLANIQTVTGAKTFNDGKLILAGATSGTTVLKTAAVAGTTTVELGPTGAETYTFPATTCTLWGTDTQRRIGLSGDYTNATTTGTEITGLSFATTGTGTFYFEWILLVQSSATGTGWKFGVNHTGTATLRSVNMTYPSTGAAAATGVGENAVANNTGSIYESAAATAFTTTAPNLGPTAGVAAANENILIKVFGLVNVTVSGDLELWCGAEAAGTITVKTDSVGQLTKYS